MAYGSKGKVTKVDGGERGVEHPHAPDAALIGDTRNKLHTAPLSKNLHMGGGHMASIPGGPDSNQLRYDEGCGTDQADDN
jgi:hypothetical protein